MIDPNTREALTKAILLECESTAELLQALFEVSKKFSKRTSIGSLAKQAKISSRGLVSDYLSGRRRPAPRYWEPLGQALQLKGLNLEVFLCILKRESTAEDSEREVFTETIKKLRKAIATEFHVLPRRARGAMLFLELFSAFGLFQNRPTREQLRHHFGAQYQLELDMLLHLLINQGVIEQIDDHYIVLKDSFKLVDSEDRYSHIEMLKAAMTDSRNHIDRWFHERDLALFSSGVVSVRRDKYQELISTIRNAVLKAHADIESSDAEMLVRFNIQIYPSPFSPPLS